MLTLYSKCSLPPSYCVALHRRFAFISEIGKRLYFAFHAKFFKFLVNITSSDHITSNKYLYLPRLGSFYLKNGDLVSTAQICSLTCWSVTRITSSKYILQWIFHALSIKDILGQRMRLYAPWQVWFRGYLVKILNKLAMFSIFDGRLGLVYTDVCRCHTGVLRTHWRFALGLSTVLLCSFCKVAGNNFINASSYRSIPIIESFSLGWIQDFLFFRGGGTLDNNI